MESDFGQILPKVYFLVRNFKVTTRGKSKMTPCEVENLSSVSPACRERRLNGAVSLNIRIKRVVLCRCLDRHDKEPCEMSMALGARPKVQLLLKSAGTSMCCRIYKWNIVTCVVNNQSHSLIRKMIYFDEYSLHVDQHILFWQTFSSGRISSNNIPKSIKLAILLNVCYSKGILRSC